MTRTVFCLLAALFLHFTPLASQEITAVDSGRLVRVTLRARPQVTGILLRPWSPAHPALFVCRTMPNGCESINDAAARWIDSAAIRKVAAQRGTQWRRGTVTGMVIGSFVGTALMLALNSMTCDDCSHQPGRNSWLAIPAGTAAFGLLGGGIGLTLPAWRPITLPQPER